MVRQRVDKQVPVSVPVLRTKRSAAQTLLLIAHKAMTSHKRPRHCLPLRGAWCWAVAGWIGDFSGD
jgi:hypothetical protein